MDFFSPQFSFSAFILRYSKYLTIPSLVVAILTVCCDFMRHYRSVFMVLWFPQQTEVISVHVSNWLVLISDKAFVLFEEVTGFCMLKGKGHTRKDHEGPEWN